MKTHILRRDFETRSVLDLRDFGVHRYAADPSTEVLCVAYAIDDGPVHLWWRGDPVPAPWFEAAADTSWEVEAHNDPFETALEQHILGPRYGFPIIPIEQHRCSLVMASALALPAKLGKLADVLELVNRKDAAGEKLMHQMAKPRKALKGEAADGILYYDDEERLRRLGEYGKQDVEVERELSKVLRALVPEEHELWQLTATINNRGFHVDREFAEAARRIAQAAAPEIDAELDELTGGSVTSINQVARLQEWLKDQGCECKSLNKKDLEKLLTTELPPAIQQVIQLRLGGAQAATKKINALLTRAGDDGRVRGSFQHHGAATGRWTGSGFQPQNLKRITVENIDDAIATVATGDYELMRTKYEKPLAVVGECSRPMMNAAPGHKLIGADYSSIENRVLPWAADETWKLESYRRYDATHDPRDEPYCITACKIFRVPDGSFTKGSPERTVGKTCELSFGYMGALGAWRKFEPDKFSDQEVETFKKEWRAAHPRIVQFWDDIDRAALTAVRERGRVVTCGCAAFKCTGSFLFMRLPSGRKIAYPFPRVKIVDSRNWVVVFNDNTAGQFKDCRNGRGAYAGLWVENLVSGIARDLLADAMKRVEAAGYPIILTVHDEIVCEVPEGFGSVEEFTRLMTQVPDYAAGLPIAASCWTGRRYTK